MKMPAWRTRRFSHDCEACTLIGLTETHDLYVCAQGSPGGGHRTIVARYGDHGPDYVSGDGLVYLDTPLGRVQLRFEKPEHKFQA
jgi:hypothetical protein